MLQMGLAKGGEGFGEAGKVSKERDVHSLNFMVFRTKIHVFAPQRAHVESRLKQPPPLKVYFILY